MKQISTFKRMFAAALLVVAGASQAFANEYEIAWIKAEAYPTGAGLVYTDYANRDNNGNIITEESMPFAATSEFKRSTNGAITDGYVWSKVTDSDYQLAGYARDTNKNGIFDNDTNTDKQVKVNYDGLFTCIQYPEKINGSSSSESAEMAEEALAAKTEPSDHVFAVFTKGTVAVMKPGQEAFGRVWASKLSNEPGEQVQFMAYSDSHESKYYKFDHWENAAGENIGTDRLLTVTAENKGIYYACVIETTKEDYLANEKDPHISDSESGEFPWESAIPTVAADKAGKNSAWYDLQGRRVAQPSKGLFIQNGKKMVIR